MGLRGSRRPGCCYNGPGRLAASGEKGGRTNSPNEKGWQRVRTISEQGSEIDRILVPTDGSECSEKAAAWAANLAKKLSARVHVLFVAETDYCGPWFYFLLDEPVCEKLRQKGKEIAEKTAQAVRESGVKEVEVHVEEGHPGEVIVEMASKLGTDLIVMGTHGRRGLERALMGSVAREVANTTTVPLLMVK